MNITKKDLAEIVLWAKKHRDIKQVYLYGSRARGDNKPGSDIDLAIMMNMRAGDENAFATWIFWQEDFKENPDLHLSSEIHLQWYEKNEGLERVGPGVENDGILLYTAKSLE